MLFERREEPVRADLPLWLPEEQTTTPRGIFKIASFAACAFFGMAFLVDEPAVPLFVGALILTTLAVTAGWLKFQSRYGSAVLTATTQFGCGRRFEGEIETGLTSIPAAPVRIHIFARRGRMTTLSVRKVIAPERMRTDANGKVRIPFSVDVPDDEWGRRTAGVRLYVRTRTWPLGWGATFLLVSPWGTPE